MSSARLGRNWFLPVADRKKTKRDLEAELRFYKDREKHYAKLLDVTDGGQYRADWDGAIDRLVRERDEAVAEAAKARVPETCDRCGGTQRIQADKGDWDDCPECHPRFKGLDIAGNPIGPGGRGGILRPMDKKTSTEKAPPGSLVIAETSTSTWNYHIRRVGPDGKLYFGGAAPPALCGRSLGWDTKQPIANWGVKSHIPETWCSDCYDVARDELVKSALLPAMDIAQKGLKPVGWVAAVNFSGLKSLEGRPRYKTCALAAKNATMDLGKTKSADADGLSFLVGRVQHSTSFANGCFTEVFVLGDVVTYEMCRGKPVVKKTKA